MSATTTVDAPQTSEGEGVNTGAPTTGQAPAPATSGAATTPKADAEKTLTQSDVDRIVETRLAEEKRKNEAKVEREKKAAAEKAAVESGEWKTLYEGAKETIAKLEATIESGKLETIRQRLINKYRLAAEDAEFIFGSTEAEMEERARRYAKRIPPPKAPDTEAGKGGGGGKQTIEQERQAQLATGRYSAIG